MKKFFVLIMVITMLGGFSACENVAEIKQEDTADNSRISAEDAKAMRSDYAERLYEIKIPDEYMEWCDDTSILIDAYEKSDKILNEVYAELKNLMSEEEFKELEKDEIEWIKKKEREAEEEYQEWYKRDYDEYKEKHAEDAKYNSLYSATYERCYYLVMLIGESGRDERLEFFNKYEHIFDNLDKSLTMGNQSEMNQYAGQKFDAAEAYYEEICNYRKADMSTEEREEFEKAEKEWREELDEVLSKYSDRIQYGSAAPLTMSAIGVQRMYERSMYILALIG